MVRYLSKLTITGTLGLQLFQLLRFGVMFLISIYLAKSSITQSAIGHYETFLFLSSFISYFWVSGLIQTMLPAIGRIDSTPSASLFNAFLVILVFSLFTLGAGFIAKPILTKMQGVGELPYYSLTIAYAVISAPGYLVEYIYLLRGKARSIILYGVTIFILQLLLVATALQLGYGIKGVVYVFIAVACLKFIWATLLMLRYSQLSLSMVFIKRFIILGIPLVGKILVSGSASYIDGAIISAKYSASTFAVYRYGARDFPLVTLLANALSNSMLPDFSDRGKLGEALKQLKRRSAKLMHILFPATIVLIVISKPLFPLLFSPEFASSAKVFMVYQLIISSRLLFPQTVAIGLGRTKPLLAISFVELAINVSLSLILIFYIGIIGVALATVIAYLAEKFMLIVFLKRSEGISVSEYIPIRLYFCYMVLTGIAFLFGFFVV